MRITCAILVLLFVPTMALASQVLYVSDSGGPVKQVAEWTTAQTGNVAPNIILNSTSFSAGGSINGVAVDSHNNLWVSVHDNVTAANNSIAEFPLNASGTTAASHVINNVGTSLLASLGLSFDKSGNLWVSRGDGTTPTIVKFTAAQIAGLLAGGSGNLTPVLSITDSSSTLTDASDVHLDSSGRIFVSDVFSGHVVAFPASASGSTAPTFTIAYAGGGLPYQFAIDSGGHLWVTNNAANSAQEWDVSVCSTGACTPTVLATLNMPGGNVSFPAGLALDASGNIWIANEANNGTILNDGQTVTEFFTNTTQGNNISGASVTLYTPQFLAIGLAPSSGQTGWVF